MSYEVTSSLYAGIMSRMSHSQPDNVNGYQTDEDFLWTDGSAVRTADDFLCTDGSAVRTAEDFGIY